MIKTQILHNSQIIQGAVAELGQKHTTVWMDVADPIAADWEMIADHIAASPEELSDLLHRNQRPVLQDIGNFTAVVFHAGEIQKDQIRVQPLLLLASKEQKDFISIHRDIPTVIEKINSYSEKRKVEIFQKGSTALLFAALSEGVGSAFEVVDYISDEISKLEEQVFKPQIASSVVQRIFHIKKGLIYFQRALSADREVISEIEKSYGQFLDAKQISNFRSLYSDLTQLLELTATYRDIMISTLEVHLSAISNNLNVVMKRLTAWAAIILVPSLIAGFTA